MTLYQVVSKLPKVITTFHLSMDDLVLTDWPREIWQEVGPEMGKGWHHLPQMLTQETNLSQEVQKQVQGVKDEALLILLLAV